MRPVSPLLGLAILVLQLAACRQILGINDDPRLLSSGTGGGGHGGGAGAGSAAGGGTGSGGPWARFPLPPDSPPASNYTIAAETVIDTTTGLEWQRAIAGQTLMVGTDAAGVCQSLHAGGFSDWRLPTRMELLTLLFYDRVGVKISAQAFPDDPNAEDDVWTSSVSVSFADARRWAVSFSSTALDALPVAAVPAWVRCVRVAEVKNAGAAPHYTVAGGVARDDWTGLSWAVDAPAFAKIAQAQAHCSTLKLGPFTSGFRVPSMKELWSLWDETASSGPLWDHAVFGAGPGGKPPVTVTTFWSATGEFGSPTQQWGLDFWGAAALVSDDDNVAYSVRCVHD